MGKLLRVAIAIPTYNRGAVLLDTLAEIYKQDRLPDEVIVVDQSSRVSPDVAKKIQELCDLGKLRYIRQETPNLPMARNEALRQTTSDIVIFIDDDVELHPGFIGAHLGCYAEESVQAVAGRVDQRRGWARRPCAKSWRRELDYRYFKLDGDVRTVGVANMIGCNHSVRTAYALQIRGYDERYTGVALREETDMALRIYLAGGVIVFEPAASLLHLAAPSDGCRRRGRMDISAALCLVRFTVKFSRVLRSTALLELWRALRLSTLRRDIVIRPYLWLFMWYGICSYAWHLRNDANLEVMGCNKQICR